MFTNNYFNKKKKKKKISRKYNKKQIKESVNWQIKHLWIFNHKNYMNKKNLKDLQKFLN